ncbi:hypothetical protein [Sphingomonas desiccabilis]|uniref:DUF4350 domain-containing protein n=1 Tax=Sphingomonas desiccabilis TaxID=429134 RepID=A0A4Q2IUK0_9SPHN|nr:hypothetical protein [Sphingomonas desiccabilis]MBB3909439.1 hypothetical protein [Sphingomonas desiccabilis]RXZ34185.1 hypothetical protein EO081_00205 [Sphingomonas desiccabilis]
MSATTEPFARRTAIVLVVVGTLLALAAILLNGFSDVLSRRLGSLPAADEKHGAGYYALRQLVDRTGGGGSLVVDPEDLAAMPELAVLTPAIDTQPEQVAKLVQAREAHAAAAEEEDTEESGDFPTLIVLPKWRVSALPLQPNRVQRVGLLSSEKAAALIPAKEVETDYAVAQGLRSAPGWKFRPFLAPRYLRAVSGKTLVPILRDGDGAAVLARIGRTNTYVLSDPDLLNNAALKHPQNAQAAIALLAALDPKYPGAAVFDASLHYGPGDRNLVKLLFTPPFLAATLAMIAAAVLAGLATAARFGPVLRERRAVALGKAALIDNIAALTRLSGRTLSAGPRYADIAREGLVRSLDLPRDLDEAGVLARLDRLGDRPAAYSQIDHRLRTARTEAELVAAARQLHAWKEALA